MAKRKYTDDIDDLSLGTGVAGATPPADPIPPVRAKTKLDQAVEAARLPIREDVQQFPEMATRDARQVASQPIAPQILRENNRPSITDPSGQTTFLDQRGMTAQQVSQRLATPQQFDPTDFDPGSYGQGQILVSPDGNHFLNDAQGGQQVPMMRDPGGQKWVPRDEYIEQIAEDDADVAQEWRKLQKEERAVRGQLGDGLDDEQEAAALQQIDQRKWAVAKGTGARSAPKTPQQEFTEQAVVMDHGVYAKDSNGDWKRLGDGPSAPSTLPPEQEFAQQTFTDKHGRTYGKNKDGKWDEISDAPADENEKRRTQFLKSWFDTYKALTVTTKNTAGDTTTTPPSPDEVQKIMEQASAAFEEFTQKDMGGGGMSPVSGNGLAGEDARDRRAMSPPNIGEAALATPENLEFTAKKHGITVDEVKRRLGMS